MSQKNRTKQQTTRFLKRSFILATAFCLLVFALMAVQIFHDTFDTVDRISHAYMKEINQQIRQKFDALVSLRVVQLQGIVDQVPAEGAGSREDMLADLCEKARVRELISLGLYSQAAGFENVLGDVIEIAEIDANSWCADGHHLVLLGYNAQGEKQFVLGVEAAYPMADGSQSEYLLAGIPAGRMNEAMVLEDENSMVITHIVSSDGEYVIGNGDAQGLDNVYERIYNEFTPVSGMTVESYAGEIRTALQGDADYNSRYILGGEVRRMYCTKLSEHFGCYIITVMPETRITDMVDDMYVRRFVTMFVAVLLIMGMVSFIFNRYYRSTVRRMDELEQARYEADEANKAKGNFLSSISHDIRTPLNAIIGMTDMALKNANNPEKTVEQLHKVQLSGQHLLGLINDVLDMSSVENGKMTLDIHPFVLREFCNDAVSIVQPLMRSRGQQFDVQIGEILSDVVCSDRVKLSQVLLNLLSNATKYTPDGGRVALRMYQAPSMAGEGFVATHFEVLDNGVGMSREFMARMFKPFEREQVGHGRQVPGTGLGLSITKAILDMMGGTISVQSKLNQGSAFHVTLNMKKGEEAAKPERTQAEPAGLEGRRVLVAEDIDINWEITQDMLGDLGLVLERAENGRVCVEMFAASAPGYYDAILMDIHMPEMDGFAATEQIRGMNRPDHVLPVIAMTADVFEDDVRQCYKHGMSAYIAKPVSLAECEKVLRKHLS